MWQRYDFAGRVFYQLSFLLFSVRCIVLGLNPCQCWTTSTDTCQSHALNTKVMTMTVKHQSRYNMYASVRINVISDKKSHCCWTHGCFAFVLLIIVKLYNPNRFFLFSFSVIITKTFRFPISKVCSYKYRKKNCYLNFSIVIIKVNDVTIICCIFAHLKRNRYTSTVYGIGICIILHYIYTIK